jgi:hypothetical protein
MLVLEAIMGGRRQQSYNGRALAISVGWIFALLACYWLIADWQAVPRFISATLAAMH